MLIPYQKLPSAEGSIKCPMCGGRGYTIVGPNNKGKMICVEWCFECSYSYDEGEDINFLDKVSTSSKKPIDM